MRNTILIEYLYKKTINGVVMDLKKLTYFIEITKTLNLSKAAENLHISQPPLSYQLKQLEEDLGVTLFDRNTRHLKITPAGQQLKERANQILELVEITREELSKKEMTLRIGFVASSSALLSPEKLTYFHEKHQDVKFVMKEGSTYKVIEYLNRGLIDIGLVRTPFDAKAYQVDYLKAEPMIAIYDKTQYTLDENIQLGALMDLPLVLDGRFEDLVVSACHHHGFLPNIICSGEDSRSILSWSEAGLGIAILPFSGKDFIKNSQLSYAIIKAKALETQGAILTLKNKMARAYLEDMIEIIKE